MSETSSRTAGTLIIIGGGESKPGAILREFVRRAGGERARIAVMTAATDDPVSAEREYSEVFRRLGADEVHGLRTNDRHDARSRGVTKILDSVTAVFLTGGSQESLVQRLGGTPAHEAIRRRLADGLVLGGTSAGASAMSETMLITGDSEEDPYRGMIEFGQGLGFLPGVILDQHFTQRGRIGRLLSAVAERPRELGVGIAEDTALVVTGGRFEVIGSGAATVLDASSTTRCVRVPSGGSDALAVCGMTLHSLPAGTGFDLSSRTPFLPERAEEAAA